MATTNKKLQAHAFENEYHRLRLNIMLSANWLSNEMRAFPEPYDITQKQFNILRILRGVHPDSLPIQDVRDRMIDKMSDASRLIDRLVRKGYVEKCPCPTDRRSNRAFITQSGLDLLHRIDRNMGELDAVMQRLSESDARRLNDLLDQMRGGEA